MKKEKEFNTRIQFKKEFAKLMETTSIPINLSQEEIIKAIRELHDFVQPNIPAKLFRYRKCGIDEVISFEQGTISMCVADKFSDKYDSNVFYNHKTLSYRFEKSFELVMSNNVQILRSNPAAFPDSPIKSKILELIKTNATDSEIVNVSRGRGN